MKTYQKPTLKIDNICINDIILASLLDKGEGDIYNWDDFWGEVFESTNQEEKQMKRLLVTLLIAFSSMGMLTLNSKYNGDNIPIVEAAEEKEKFIS